MNLTKQLLTRLVVVLPLLIVPTTVNAERHDGYYRHRHRHYDYHRYHRPYYYGHRFDYDYSPYYEHSPYLPYGYRYYGRGYYGTPRFHYHDYGRDGGTLHLGPLEFNWRR